MDILENKNNNEDPSLVVYKTLDKDYGRVLFAGPGYGDLNPEEYAKLEESLR